MAQKKASKSLTYADAGVDISVLDKTKKAIGALAKLTYNKGVVGGFGHFAGLFHFTDLKNMEKPVLVSSVDGVGTKLKIAFETGMHGTVGEDIVNHCINDILVLGAKPLFFLDYLASGKMDPDIVLKVIEGMAKACKTANCVLIGGETAEMPEFYKKGEYDLAGTIVGVVDESHIEDGRHIRDGDYIIGLRSSGLHTNGFSLARKIVTEVAKKKYSDVFKPTGKKFGEELLIPHRSYLTMHPIIKQKIVRGCAHITGGGFPGNVGRILPGSCDAVIDTKTWRPQPIFSWLQEAGNVKPLEMYSTFNMGMGMVLVVSPVVKSAVFNASETTAFRPVEIGRIVNGTGKVTLEF
jgi:phosphoribosylformylglycinamidine cyclo-ligase